VEEERADAVREAVDAAFADAELATPTHLTVLPSAGASVSRSG
jgi:3,4-dihydroxy-2-butanone 4-phosphate synthase